MQRAILHDSFKCCPTTFSPQSSPPLIFPFSISINQLSSFYLFLSHYMYIYWSLILVTSLPHSLTSINSSFMASLAYLSLTFLFLLASSLLQIHARELNSFNKDVRNEFPSDTVTKHEEIMPTVVGGEQPENLPPQSQNGYGLYGRRPEEYFPTDERSSLPATEYNTEIPDDREANAFYQQYESQKNNGQYGMSTEIPDGREANAFYQQHESQKNNGQYGMSDKRASTEIPDGREANAFYQQDETQKNKGQYGMSDTRAFENGKYFYDLNNHRHGGVYDPTRGNFEGYGVKDNGRFGYGVFNYEGRRNGYGYSQEMEGKHNYQRQGIDREEHYVP